MRISIERCDWTDCEESLRAIREQVFVIEQQVPVDIEMDGLDATAMHWPATVDERPVATARMLIDGHIGRVAVLEEYRQLGIGSQLLQSMQLFAQEQQYYKIYLYAQLPAMDFYQRAGFVVDGPEFMEAAIPHRRMSIRLSEQRLLGLHGGDFSSGSLKALLLELIPQINRKLQILHMDYCREIFNDEAIVASISALARKSRYTEVQLLLVDPHELIGGNHRLGRLQRSPSSIIELRQIRAEPHTIKENLIIADGIGMARQSITEPENIIANLNNKPIATDATAFFNELWNRSVENKDLRQLDI